MLIAVKCINCGWVGIAEVGGRMGGPSVSDQCCPNCHSDIKPRAGTYDPADGLAEYRE